MGDKASLEQLQNLERQAEGEHKIITNEMVQFSEGLKRAQNWLGRVKTLEQLESG